MKITALLENTSVSPNYESKHGLSFYIETQTNKILADLGPDESFCKNAKAMGIDISLADMVFISHGHNDHGGGLKCFLENNNKAKIYINHNGFNNFYVDKNGEIEYIGLDKTLENNNSIIKTDGFIKINSDISIFSSVTERKAFPKANDILMMEHNGKIQKDSFSHEQYLVINQNGKLILIGGCAHNGILNILKRFKEIYNKEPDFVLSGFHLYNSLDKTPESDQLLNEICDGLSEYDSKFYTCHCTGDYAYNFIKERLGDKIDYIATGMVLYI